MDCEHRGNKGAAPNAASLARTAGHLQQHEEKKHRRNNVQEHIGEMVTSRLQSI
jgi:hypothetical protein